MPEISHYMDYRRYLHDYYIMVKKRNPHFSYQVFSEKAGISSKGLLYNVIMGKRHLSKSHIVGMGKALKLNKHEFDYFENLFAYNCSKTADDKRHYFERLTSINVLVDTSWQPQTVRQEQFEYYSRWYHSAIRSLIGMQGFSGDYQALAKLLNPSITPGKVKKSVELLCSLGFLRRTGKDEYKIAHRTIVTDPEVASVAIQSFHKQSGELALTALMNLPIDQRNFTAVTAGISERMYGEVCEEINEFRMRLLKKIESDHDAKRVYQINFQCFPVSHDPDGRRKR